MYPAASMKLNSSANIIELKYRGKLYRINDCQVQVHTVHYELKKNCTICLLSIHFQAWPIFFNKFVARISKGREGSVLSLTCSSALENINTEQQQHSVFVMGRPAAVYCIQFAPALYFNNICWLVQLHTRAWIHVNTF